MALLWNVAIAVQPRRPPHLRDLLARQRDLTVPDEQRYASGAWRRALEASEHFGALLSARAEHEQRLDCDGLVAQIGSFSYVASLQSAEREALLAHARRLAPSTCTITLRTDLYWTTKVRRG